MSVLVLILLLGCSSAVDLPSTDSPGKATVASKPTSGPEPEPNKPKLTANPWLEEQDPVESDSDVRPATSTPQSIHSLLPCDSAEFILPESEVATTQTISGDEQIHRSLERYSWDDDQLSLYLTLTENALEYAGPIAFRLAVTNSTDQPVVFPRPEAMTLDEVQPPRVGLIVHLQPLVGKWNRPAPMVTWATPELKREDFSVLSPGASCTMDFQLFAWKEGARYTPPPPGDYQMGIRMHSQVGAPMANWKKMIFYDLDTWVGRTKASNMVTLTVSPLEE